MLASLSPDCWPVDLVAGGGSAVAGPTRRRADTRGGLSRGEPRPRLWRSSAQGLFPWTACMRTCWRGATARALLVMAG